MKARANIDPEEELALFVYRLFRLGVCVLPCGGGVIYDPALSIDQLAGWYNRDDLNRLCLEITRRTAEPGGCKLPEEVCRTVTSILRHLADEDSFDPWNQRLEYAVVLILAVACFPICLYFWWRERREERQWLNRHRSRWMAAPAKGN